MKSPYLQTALDAVKAAEHVIMSYYQSNLTVTNKADHTPVTIADKEAEEIIKATIHAAFPDHTFFGEEGEKTDLHDHKGYSWIIDPIDGTKSFIRGIPLFGTLLALMHDGELILGVSNAPVWGEMVYAVKGEGAYRGETRLYVSETSNLSDMFISNGRLKYFEDIERLPQLLALGREAKWARGMSDFWVYHLVAQGSVDVMMEGSVKFWDIAAAKVIIEEAGGQMTQLDGQPITYQSTTALATNGRLHDAIVERMA